MKKYDSIKTTLYKPFVKTKFEQYAICYSSRLVELVSTNIFAI